MFEGAVCVREREAAETPQHIEKAAKKPHGQPEKHLLCATGKKLREHFGLNTGWKEA